MPNPRFLKRIKCIKTISDVMLICAKRRQSSLWDSNRCDDIICNIIETEMPTRNHLLKRYFCYKGFKNKAIESLKEYDPDAIYIEGIDCLLIASEYRRKYKDTKIYYEIGDLAFEYQGTGGPLIRKAINYIMSEIEVRCLGDIHKLIVTSPMFYMTRYRKYLSKERCIYIPNFPDISFFECYEHKSSGRFSIAFIGAIRFLDQMKMLIDATEGVDIDVYFIGGSHEEDILKELKEYAAERTNVFFLGKYNYNQDIARLYGMVDCVYSVYDVRNLNVRIALPNKLYESIICGLPILVAKNTYLGKLVRRWGVGIAVPHDEVGTLRDALIKLKSDSEFYASIVRGCAKKRREFMEQDYMEVLIKEFKEDS